MLAGQVPRPAGTSKIERAGVRRLVAQREHGRHPPGSVAPVPLFAPWVPVVVVAEALPESGLVVEGQRDAADPLRALPQVQVRDEQPGRAAVLRGQVLAVVARTRSRPGRRAGPPAAGWSCSRRRSARPRSRPPSRRRRRACRGRRPARWCSSFDHLVTQCRSTVTSCVGSARNAAQSQLCTCPVSVVILNSQSSSRTRGVGPADSTGKSAVRYWPGGSSARSERARPVNPGDTIPMWPPPWLVGRSAQKASRLSGMRPANRRKFPAIPCALRQTHAD